MAVNFPRLPDYVELIAAWRDRGELQCLGLWHEDYWTFGLNPEKTCWVSRQKLGSPEFEPDRSPPEQEPADDQE